MKTRRVGTTCHHAGQALAPHARRGTLSVAVLSVAILVTLIGLSALLAMRVSQRAASMTETAARTDSLAQSVVDVVLFRMASNPNWRTTYTSGAWTAGQAASGATLSFRLVDEIDANLANDPNQPVRLYARAVIGDTTRIYSVLLEPRGSRNLLTNGDMEAGTASWYASNCQLEVRTHSSVSGSKCLYVTSQPNAAAGIGQSVANAVRNGATYAVGLWARMDSGSLPVRVRLHVTASSSGTQIFSGGATTVGTSWTRMTGNITPTWSGTLSAANLFIDTSSGTTSFRLDDVSLIETGPRSPMVPVPGTWRREVLP